MRLLTVALLAGSALGAVAQPGSPAADSVRIAVRAGASNPELRELMSKVLHIEKLHIEAHNARLAGKIFHLTYQEYRHGVPDAEKELTGNAARLLSFNKQGTFTMDVFARVATENTLENQFLFAAGSIRKTFKPLPGQEDLYSLSENIWDYKPVKAGKTSPKPAASPGPAEPPTLARNFATGKKVPFLVYTLPYEKDGWFLYCSLIQSKVPVADWYAKFKIPHFIVYNLLVE